MSEEIENQLQTAIKLGMEAGIPKQVDGLAVPYTVLPGDSKLVKLEDLLETPCRKRGRMTFYDVASFGRYVKDHRTEATIILDGGCNIDGTIKAVFDHHFPGEDSKAGWCEHTANFVLRFTPEWIDWAGGNGKMMSQEAFAQFIERNMADIASPAGADLLELARNLTARVATEFGSVIYAAGSKINFMEVREAGGGGGLKVPDKIQLGLPVYKGFSRYAQEARIRVKIAEKHLQLGYDLIKPGNTVDAANLEVLAAVEKATGIKPLAGRMES